MSRGPLALWIFVGVCVAGVAELCIVTLTIGLHARYGMGPLVAPAMQLVVDAVVAWRVVAATPTAERPGPPWIALWVGVVGVVAPANIVLFIALTT